MAHGAPDDSDVLKWGDTERVTDLGELAARLGDMLSQRRGGEWLFRENWAYGKSLWIEDTNLSGSALTLSGLYSRSMGVALRMDIAVGLAARSRIYAYVPVLAESSVGIQCDWYFESGLPKWWLDIDYFTGTTKYMFDIFWLASNETLYYVDANGAYVALDTPLKLDHGAVFFHNMKLVADFIKGEYVRFEVNKETYDMAGIAAKEVTTSDGPYMILGCSVLATAVVGGTAYLDNIIITRNER